MGERYPPGCCVTILGFDAVLRRTSVRGGGIQRASVDNVTN